MDRELSRSPLECYIINKRSLLQKDSRGIVCIDFYRWRANNILHCRELNYSRIDPTQSLFAAVPFKTALCSSESHNCTLVHLIFMKEDFNSVCFVWSSSNNGHLFYSDILLAIFFIISKDFIVYRQF